MPLGCASLSIIISNQKITLKLLQQILRAVCYIHDREIIHRDIKSNNILLMHYESLHFALADFEFAKKTFNVRTFCDTPDYITSEILRGRTYGCKSDIYSLKVVSFETFDLFLKIQNEAQKQSKNDLIKQYDLLINNRIFNQKLLTIRGIYEIERIFESFKIMILQDSATRATAQKALNLLSFKPLAPHTRGSPNRSTSDHEHQYLERAKHAAGITKRTEESSNFLKKICALKPPRATKNIAACNVRIARALKNEPSTENHEPINTETQNLRLLDKPTRRPLSSVELNSATGSSKFQFYQKGKRFRSNDNLPLSDYEHDNPKEIKANEERGRIKVNTEETKNVIQRINKFRKTEAPLCLKAQHIRLDQSKVAKRKSQMIPRAWCLCREFSCEDGCKEFTRNYKTCSWLNWRFCQQYPFIKQILNLLDVK